MLHLLNLRFVPLGKQSLDFLPQRLLLGLQAGQLLDDPLDFRRVLQYWSLLLSLEQGGRVDYAIRFRGVVRPSPKGFDLLPQCLLFRFHALQRLNDPFEPRRLRVRLWIWIRILREGADTVNKTARQREHTSLSAPTDAVGHSSRMISTLRFCLQMPSP